MESLWCNGENKQAAADIENNGMAEKAASAKIERNGNNGISQWRNKHERKYQQWRAQRRVRRGMALAWRQYENQRMRKASIK